jgi:hypothetical protein
MSYLKVYIYREPDLDIENPSPEQVAESIQRLDGSKITNLVLIIHTGNLFIYSSTEGRMHVAYSGIGPVNAYLIDHTQPETTTIEFPLENGGVDDWSLRETVSRETAIEVAVHFLKNNAFPQGLNWEGNMHEFS